MSSGPTSGALHPQLSQPAPWRLAVLNLERRIHSWSQSYWERRSHFEKMLHRRLQTRRSARSGAPQLGHVRILSSTFARLTGDGPQMRRLSLLARTRKAQPCRQRLLRRMVAGLRLSSCHRSWS